ncbi:MAG: hypothetical protein DRI92_02625 [Aquificota bacterium]|nr:MAG: hypothetical protein DRI92_02625 [Aquificota bacterium]
MTFKFFSSLSLNPLSRDFHALFPFCKEKGREAIYSVFEGGAAISFPLEGQGLPFSLWNFIMLQILDGGVG